MIWSGCLTKIIDSESGNMKGRSQMETVMAPEGMCNNMRNK